MCQHIYSILSYLAIELLVHKKPNVFIWCSKSIQEMMIRAIWQRRPHRNTNFLNTPSGPILQTVCVPKTKSFQKYFCSLVILMIHSDKKCAYNYTDVIMIVMASQITSLTIVYSTVYSGTDQIKHQSSASLVFMRGIHRGPVNSPHKGPVTRKMFPFADVIMCYELSGRDICKLYIMLYTRPRIFKRFG